jgi:hypothetical protein
MSDEEFLATVLKRMDVAISNHQSELMYCDDMRALLKDRVAQRQAGREEMRAILTEAMEAMDERRCYLDAWEWKYKERWDKEDAAIRKALSDLDEARLK